MSFVARDTLPDTAREGAEPASSAERAWNICQSDLVYPVHLRRLMSMMTLCPEGKVSQTAEYLTFPPADLPLRAKASRQKNGASLCRPLGKFWERMP